MKKLTIYDGIIIGFVFALYVTGIWSAFAIHSLTKDLDALEAENKKNREILSDIIWEGLLEKGNRPIFKLRRFDDLMKDYPGLVIDSCIIIAPNPDTMAEERYFTIDENGDTIPTYLHDTSQVRDQLGYWHYIDKDGYRWSPYKSTEPLPMRPDTMPAVGRIRPTLDSALQWIEDNLNAAPSPDCGKPLLPNDSTWINGKWVYRHVIPIPPWDSVPEINWRDKYDSVRNMLVIPLFLPLDKKPPLPIMP